MTAKKPHHPRRYVNDTQRYPDREEWLSAKREARKRTSSRCCLCGEVKSSLHLHHAAYQMLAEDGTILPVKGREKGLIGIVLFPLCEACHGIAHKPENWIRRRDNPTFANRNTINFALKLRQGFEQVDIRRFTRRIP